MGKDHLAADAAREEMASLLIEKPAPTADKQPDKPAPPATKNSCGATATDRQKAVEEKRKEAEAAQKIVDCQKEKARLE